MADVTIESLQLEVEAPSAEAAKSIDALTRTLTTLKSTTKGLGLSGVTKQIKNLNSSLDGVNGANADKLDRLAEGMKKLSSCSGMKISSTVATQITAIGAAVRSLENTNFSTIGSLGTALSSLSSVGKSNLNSFVNPLGKLPQVISGLNGVDMAGAGSRLSQLATAFVPLTQMGKSNLAPFITQLSKIPKLMQDLKSVDISALTTQIQQLANAFAPLATQMQAISAGFASFPNRIQRLIQTTNNLSRANNNASKSYINLWAKCRMAMNIVKTGARVLSSWIHTSNQYIEDLNLFTASMGEYAEEAKKYAEQVGEIMGIDPGEFMRNQGVFNTIIKGFGVASDKAYLMSKNLTQLGYDISSFYNISFENAMQKLQSGISGELEPLRRLGYDLSVARLEQERLRLGIDKSVSSMTQAEKSQLRYYAIMTQVKDAQGDMARTLNAPANQLRVLKAQVQQCARALGNIFIPALNAVLPYAIALAKVIRLLANSIANLFGFKLPEVDYSSLTAGSDAIGDIADNAEDATGAAKKLKHALTGIDELNIISPEDDKSGSGSGNGLGGSDLGIDLPTYDFLGDAISSKVDEIIQKMKEWLGLTDDINSWSDFLHTRLGHILTTVGAIALGLAAWKISKGVLDALQYINMLKGYGLTNPLTIAVGISLLVTGIALEWAGIIDTILNELDGENFAQIISGGLLTVGGGAFLGKGIAGWITTAFADSAIAGALETAAANLGLGSATAAGAALGAGVAGIIAGIPAYAVGIYDAIKNGLNWLNGLLIPAGSTAAAAGIGAIIGACGGPIGAGIGALIGLVVGLVTDGVIAIVQHWDQITAFFKKFFTVTIPNLWNSFVQWVKDIPSNVKKFFTDLWQPIKDFDWKQFGYDVGQKTGTAVKNICQAFKKFFTETLPEVWEKVKEGFKTFFTETLPKFFTETIPEFFKSVKDAFVTFFTETLPEALSDIGEWFVDVGQAIWEGIKEGWNTAIKAIKDFIDGFVQGFKDALGIHSPSTVFRDEIGKFLGEGILEGILAPFKKIAQWVKKNIIEPIKKAIKNNPISDMVIGIKNNASEWWEKAKNWWADASKNGINLEAGVELAKKGWSTVKGWIGSIPVVKQFVGLAKHLWTSVKEWIGNIPIVEQGVKLVKEKWESVKAWVGNIPIVEQGVKLVKDRWESVREWIGNIPTLSQYIQLLKEKWTTVKEWVGNIPTLPQLIHLAKDRWNTIKEWIGNIPVLSQYIQLLKERWTTVREWIGNIPVLSQFIQLAKSGWDKVSSWVEKSIGGAVNKGIGLATSGWTTVQAWVNGKLGGAVNKAIGLAVSDWTTVAGWVNGKIGGAVNKAIGLTQNGWSTVASWVSGKIGGAVGVTVNLLQGWKGTIKKWLGFEDGGVMTDKGVLFNAAGGIYQRGIPMYAGGTNSPTHGSMFVAGEHGAEIVGHINGRTEVMNRFQLSDVMYSSIVGGMAPFTEGIMKHMSVCTNAVIRSILVSVETIRAASMEQSTFDPTKCLSQVVYEDCQRAYQDSYTEEAMYRSMKEFYHNCIENPMNRMVAGIERQADKEEQTIVQVGNRTITDAVVTQQSANGYRFVTP